MLHPTVSNSKLAYLSIACSLAGYILDKHTPVQTYVTNKTILEQASPNFH